MTSGTRPASGARSDEAGEQGLRRPGVGSDSHGEDVLRVEVGGYREMKWPAVGNCLLSLKRGPEDADLEIHLDVNECRVDWDAGPDDSPWARSENEYDLPEEEADE
jgi:hypothetical protein